LLHRAYGVAGFAGLAAGFDVKVDLRAFREKLSNIPFDMFGDGVSVGHGQRRRHPEGKMNAMETSR
jgi:hypothetical protein